MACYCCKLRKTEFSETLTGTVGDGVWLEKREFFFFFKGKRKIQLKENKLSQVWPTEPK